MVLELIEKWKSVENGVVRNVIIFGVDVSSSPRIDNKRKKIF